MACLCYFKWTTLTWSIAVCRSVFGRYCRRFANWAPMITCKDVLFSQHFQGVVLVRRVLNFHRPKIERVSPAALFHQTTAGRTSILILNRVKNVCKRPLQSKWKVSLTLQEHLCFVIFSPLYWPQKRVNHSWNLSYTFMKEKPLRWYLAAAPHFAIMERVKILSDVQNQNKTVKKKAVLEHSQTSVRTHDLAH